jgi:hypothetical protein
LDPDLTAADTCGLSAAAGFDHARRIWIRRHRTHAWSCAAEGVVRRQRPAASGGGASRRTRSRALELDSRRGRGARNGEATRGGGSGGDAAERADDTAVRLGNFGEGFRVLRCAGTATSDACGFLTSWRRPWAASRRRDCDDDEGTRRWWLWFSAMGAHGAQAARAQIREVQGVHASLNSPKEGLLGVRAKYRRVLGSDTGGGAGLSRVLLGHGRSGTRLGHGWCPPVIGCGRGRRRSRLATVVWAGWTVLNSWAATKIAGPRLAG